MDFTAVRYATARVRAALRRDDERRARERADAERARVATAERLAADEYRRQALARLFATIAEERHYLAKEKGVPVIDPRLLTRFGLTAADVAGVEASKRIAAIAEGQTIEVSSIANYVDRAPHHIVRDGERWVLDDAAPSDVRALVTAWRNDATVQRALGRVVASRSVEEAPNITIREVADEPGAAWRRARIVREQAMAESDATERLDDTGPTRPGRRMARPGTDRTEAAPPIARRLPSVPGAGFGD